MWKLEPTDEYNRRHRRYEKKHRRELEAMLDNLDTYHQALNAGTPIQQIQFGFVHAEPCGVKAVDQKGHGQGLMLVIQADAQKAHRAEVLPLSPEFCEFLLATPPEERHGRVFRPMARSGSTAPMGMDWYSDIIVRIGRMAGVKVAEGTRKGKPHIKYASAHDLRRAFATRWAPRVQPITLQRLMRHKSIQTTLAFYVFQDACALCKALRKLSLSSAQFPHQSESFAALEQRARPAAQFGRLLRGHGFQR